MITTNDPIAALDRMTQEGYDIYDAAVTIGMADETDMATRRWRQGDLTLRIEKHYGESTVVKFATALNVNTNTLKQRRTMAAFYTPDTRVSYENVGYAHFREAMKLGSLDRAVWALEKAHLKDWPVWKFALLLNRLLGKPARAEAVTGVVDSFTEGYAVIRLNGDDMLTPGQTVTIRKVAK